MGCGLAIHSLSCLHKKKFLSDNQIAQSTISTLSKNYSVHSHFPSVWGRKPGIVGLTSIALRAKLLQGVSCMAMY